MNPTTQTLEDRKKPFRLSATWDLGIPFAIAAIPAVLFSLLGLVTAGMNKPGAEVATWQIVIMLVLQTLGMISMAVVILMRWHLGNQQLSLRTDGKPANWRKAILFFSIVLLLLFDILTNVAAAFAGAGLLLPFAFPLFLGYLFCLRMAFVGL